MSPFYMESDMQQEESVPSVALLDVEQNTRRGNP
jgi:hypothetical protein